ncbi:hypothetical protein [Chitinimonas sp. JJ19]|nr:hypothetical protein [Chitinimonas sp.]
MIELFILLLINLLGVTTPSPATEQPKEQAPAGLVQPQGDTPQPIINPGV